MENTPLHRNEGHPEIPERRPKHKTKNISIDIFSVTLVDDIKCY